MYIPCAGCDVAIIILIVLSYVNHTKQEQVGHWHCKFANPVAAITTRSLITSLAFLSDTTTLVRVITTPRATRHGHLDPADLISSIALLHIHLGHVVHIHHFVLFCLFNLGIVSGGRGYSSLQCVHMCDHRNMKKRVVFWDWMPILRITIRNLKYPFSRKRVVSHFLTSNSHKKNLL